MEYEIETTEIFTKWLKGLKDLKSRKAIADRLVRVKLGNLE